MWCDACRSVGIIHCAHPDECGNMLPDRAAAENWNAWLDDLPVGAEFQSAIERLQDFIAGLAVPALTPTAVDDSQTANPVVNAPDPAAIREALDACRIIDEAVREGHESVSELVLHLLSAAEPARAALALAKGAAE